MKEEYKSRVSYENFIASKAITATSSGITVPEEELNPMLFDFQRDIVKWALAKGPCGDIRGLRRRKDRQCSSNGLNRYATGQAVKS